MVLRLTFEAISPIEKWQLVYSCIFCSIELKEDSLGDADYNPVRPLSLYLYGQLWVSSDKQTSKKLETVPCAHRAGRSSNYI